VQARRQARPRAGDEGIPVAAPEPAQAEAPPRIGSDADAVARWCLRVARTSEAVRLGGVARLGVGGELAQRIGVADAPRV
jgi:hypothetical protein